ncbi:hypothetical protein LE270_13645 [Salmonella enterica subsp. enterica serovar Hillegersberg]|uniref:hypothetical protein n=1 Tax=Salmonella enterica TaxID=28901 RepID=UPI001D06DF1C|nr:hypothetical protein [Salmonella enterica]MCB7133073.1 hypothetical protein [Salmonella enterica subsp. enterica serovar Hillegersberg]
MRIQSEKIDVLYELESSVFEYLLIAVDEAMHNGFNMVGCNVSIFLKEYLNTHKKEFMIHFFPMKITPENASEYELVQDDFCVYIDVITKKVIRSCSSI